MSPSDRTERLAVVEADFVVASDATVRPGHPRTRHTAAMRAGQSGIANLKPVTRMIEALMSHPQCHNDRCHESVSLFSRLDGQRSPSAMSGTPPDTHRSPDIARHRPSERPHRPRHPTESATPHRDTPRYTADTPSYSAGIARGQSPASRSTPEPSDPAHASPTRRWDMPPYRPRTPSGSTSPENPRTAS